jgi:alpha-L-fucosidase
VGPSPFEIAAAEGEEAAFARSPYVEWYQNALAIEGSPVADWHAEHHRDVGYEAFVDEFLAGHAGWDPHDWAELFGDVGARYVVLVTKHHDGVTLWPSATPNPFRSGWSAERDCVGDLAAAVRDRGMRFGTYYSGGLDWTFGGLPITSIVSMFQAIPQSPEYAAYADAHWRELIDRYRPCVLWNDIGYPGGGDLDALFAHYYEVVPDGIVNDRFGWGSPPDRAAADFVTPEYSTTAPDTGKWEATRGIGTSFGYNRMEPASSYLSVDELVGLLVDVTARGGNLLLNVGPMGDGRIPWTQVERLRGLGAWLDTNGAAVFDSRPWSMAPDGGGPAEATTSDGREVRFTWSPSDGAVNAVVLGATSGADPAAATVVLDWPGPAPATGSVVTRLGHGRPLAWEHTDGRLVVRLADAPADDPAITLRVARD